MENSESEDIKSGNVFCKDCVYCKNDYIKKCMNKQSIIIHKTSYKVILQHDYCYNVNKKNNCQLRKQKPWWMFWRG